MRLRSNSVYITVLIASVSAIAEVRLTVRVIPASEVLSDSCVCHLVFSVSTLSFRFSNFFICFLQVGLIILFHVRWPLGEYFDRRTCSMFVHKGRNHGPIVHKGRNHDP